MPWVYTLQLLAFRSASAIQSDWKNQTAGDPVVANDLGGVTVGDRRAVIVSTRNNPGYEDMENLSYVHSITKHKEIPSRSDTSFEPPIDLGNGFQLSE